jgi:transcriptional regulator with XRE-family HTH domain
MTSYQEIGGRIRAARDKVGLKGHELGLIINADKQTVSNYETGKTKPPAHILGQIAEACHTTTDWLITGKETKAPSQTTPFDNGQLSESSTSQQNGPDLALTKQVIEAVMEHLQSNQLTMPPAKIADLVEVLYEEISESEEKQVNKGTVARMIKLAI